MYNPVTSSEANPERAKILKNRYAALRRMQELREQAIKEGMQLLSLDEINELVTHRRGDFQD